MGPDCTTPRVLSQNIGGTSHTPATEVAIINMFPKVLLETKPMVPEFLQVEIHSGELTWNGTPTWVVTDCNVGLSMSNVSIHLGDYRGVWIIWPPLLSTTSARQEATRKEEHKVWKVVGD